MKADNHHKVGEFSTTVTQDFDDNAVPMMAVEYQDSNTKGRECVIKTSVGRDTSLEVMKVGNLFWGFSSTLRGTSR